MPRHGQWKVALALAVKIGLVAVFLNGPMVALWVGEDRLAAAGPDAAGGGSRRSLDASRFPPGLTTGDSGGPAAGFNGPAAPAQGGGGGGSLWTSAAASWASGAVIGSAGSIHTSPSSLAYTDPPCKLRVSGFQGFRVWGLGFCGEAVKTGVGLGSLRGNEVAKRGPFITWAGTPGTPPPQTAVTGGCASGRERDRAGVARALRTRTCRAPRRPSKPCATQ